MDSNFKNSGNSGIKELINKVQDIESRFENKFLMISKSVDSHSKILSYVLDHLNLDPSKIRDLGSTLDSENNQDQSRFRINIDERIDFVNKELHYLMHVNPAEMQMKSSESFKVSSEINEFLIRLRLLLLKDQINLASQELNQLRVDLASRFKLYVDCPVDTYELKDSEEQLRIIDEIFTGNVYNGKYTEEFLKYTYQILGKIIETQ